MRYSIILLCTLLVCSCPGVICAQEMHTVRVTTFSQYGNNNDLVIKVDGEIINTVMPADTNIMRDIIHVIAREIGRNCTLVRTEKPYGEQGNVELYTLSCDTNDGDHHRKR